MEKHIILFSREQDQEKIMSSIMGSFGIEQANGNKLHFENNSQNITTDIEIFTCSMGEEINNIINKQKNIASYNFTQIQNSNDDIKINLIHYIQQSKAFIPISITIPSEKSANISTIIPIILNSMKQIDSILITDDGKTVLNSEGQIILSETQSSDLQYYFPFEYQESPSFLQNCTRKQIERRNSNMKYLFDRHIYVTELPLNDDDEEIKIRSHEEVVKRSIGTLIVSLYSECLLNPEDKMSVSDARSFINNVLKNMSVEKLEDVLTEDELSYVKNDNSDKSEQISYSWNYEDLFVLEWILGLVEWNFPSEICDVAKIVRNIRAFNSINEMCEKTVLRPKSEILNMADLVYRMDWAAVDARIHRLDGPAGIDHGIIQERHRTLNWMICFDDADWDDVPTPT